MDKVIEYTDAYLKEAYEHAKRDFERYPGNRYAQRRYNELLAEMKRRGFIKSK